MADVAEVKPVEFPTWLYFKHPDGRLMSQVFDDEASYSAARAAGWHSSPASFGIETHPSNPVMLMTPADGTPVLPGASAQDIAEITAILTALQAQLDTLLTSLQAQLDTLAARCTLLESLVTAWTAEHRAPPPAPVVHTTHLPEDDKDKPPPHTGRR
jgi:hypothetical protein